MFEIILTERARRHWNRLKTDMGLEKRLLAVPGTFLLPLVRVAGIKRNFLTFWLPEPHIAIMEIRFCRDQRGGFYEDRE